MTTPRTNHESFSQYTDDLSGDQRAARAAFLVNIWAFTSEWITTDDASTYAGGVNALLRCAELLAGFGGMDFRKAALEVAHAKSPAALIPDTAAAALRQEVSDAEPGIVSIVTKHAVKRA